MPHKLKNILTIHFYLPQMSRILNTEYTGKLRETVRFPEIDLHEQNGRPPNDLALRSSKLNKILSQ